MTDAVGVCFFICNPNCLDQDTYVDPARIELASRQCECRVVPLNYGPGRDAGNRTRSSRTRSARTTGILHPDKIFEVLGARTTGILQLEYVVCISRGICRRAIIMSMVHPV